MIRLEDLLHSLVTVLVRYHDSQPVSKKLVNEYDTLALSKNSRAFSAILLKEPNFSEQLQQIIKTGTHGYPDRAPLLNFLLNEINYLKSIVDHKSSFTPQELINYKAQINQMLLDFKQLLLTAKDKTYNVTNTKNFGDDKPAGIIALSGLINNSYFGTALCNSGNLLSTEVLNRLNISTSSTTEDIYSIAEYLCNEHQNSLLVPELEEKIMLLNSALSTANTKNGIKKQEATPPYFGEQESGGSAASACLSKLTLLNKGKGYSPSMWQNSRTHLNPLLSFAFAPDERTSTNSPSMS